MPWHKLVGCIAETPVALQLNAGYELEGHFNRLNSGQNVSGGEVCRAFAPPSLSG